MTKEQWRQVKSLFALALEQPPENRPVYVREAAGGDLELEREVLSLLRAHDRPAGFSLEGNVPQATSWEPLEAMSDGHSSGTYNKICTRCRSRYGPLVFVCPQDGEPLADDPTALVGVTLDDLYHVEEFIGQGAMGRVYGARHALLRDRVAIKVLRSDLATNTDFVKRFLREGRAARAIHHPNAITVHDLRTTGDGLTYMVQEFVDGHTLRDEMEKREKMTLAEVLEYLEPVASVLDEAHAHGVVHRDLKPENIIIGTVGNKPVIKLADLGIAKLSDAIEGVSASPTILTEPGRIMGTPHYMSPEQWGAPPDDGGPDIDGRADVYSFGVIVFELLAGRKPFDIRSVRQLCLAHVSQTAPCLHEAAPEVSEATSAIVARALSKERNERPATCGQFVAELRTGIATAPGPRLEAVPEPQAPAALPARSRWPLVAGVVVFALVSVIAFWTWGVLSGTGETARGEAAAAISGHVLECAAEIQKFRDGRPVKDPLVVSADKTLLVEQGDRIRFLLSGSRAGCLYVLTETARDGADGPALTVLFPVAWANSGSERLAARQEVSLPSDASNWIQFDNERGTEVFWLVWSVEPIPMLEGVASFTNAQDRGMLDSARTQAARAFLSAAPRAMAKADETTGRTVLRSTAGAFVHRVIIQHY